jgi:Protein of unknown function (DUF3485)
VNRVVALAAILWAASGLRLVWDAVFAVTAVDAPCLPFSIFPREIAGPEWAAEDVPMDEDERLTTGVASYLQRHYTSGGRQFWFYVGFVSGRTAGAIHDPRYCYPASGLHLEREESIALVVDGLAGPARFQEGQWKDSLGQPVYSLYSLYYRGTFAPEDWRLRAARLLGVPYFASLSVTGDFVGSIEETRTHYQGIMARVIPLLLRHLPAPDRDSESSEKG